MKEQLGEDNSRDKVLDEQQQSLKLFIVLSRAYKAMNEMSNRFIQEQGLNTTEFAVLELLYHKGKQPLQKIGGKILIASGSITYVVDKLEKKGLIRRVASPTDRRITYAETTEAGNEFMGSIFPQHQEKIHDMMATLSHEEQLQAIELLKKLGLSIRDLSY